MKEKGGLREGHFAPIKKRIQKIETKIMETMGYQDEEKDVEMDYESH